MTVRWNGKGPRPESMATSAERTGRLLRIAGMERPVAATTKLDVVMLPAICLGWDKENRSIMRGGFAAEGRRLYLAGEPCPKLPIGEDYMECIKLLKQLVGERQGWIAAQKKQEKRIYLKGVVARTNEDQHRVTPNYMKPTIERETKEDLEHVQIADLGPGQSVVGSSVTVRSIDALGAMRARNSIDQVTLRCARRFQALWELARLEPRVAAHLLGVGGKGPGGITDAIEDAKTEISMIMGIFGGSNSPAGSIVWNVVGAQMSIRDWCMLERPGQRREDPKTAAGLLRGSLCALVAHYQAQRPKGSNPVVRVSGKLLKSIDDQLATAKQTA